jgi:hypothetical protein
MTLVNWLVTLRQKPICRVHVVIQSRRYSLGLGEFVTSEPQFHRNSPIQTGILYYCITDCGPNGTLLLAQENKRCVLMGVLMQCRPSSSANRGSYSGI